MNVIANTYLDAIDQQVATRSLLLHPFYQSWTQGKLSREALGDYAEQYYHHVAAFPTYLSSLHSHTEDAVVRRHILANLMDEEAGTPNHPELWLRFAEALGLNREQVQHAKLWDETKSLIHTFRRICRDRSPADGVAALYAYESQIPAVAESKIDGLRKFYSFRNERGLAYFRVHVEADREHAEVERGLLESYLNETTATSATESAGEVLDALWALLSAVCRRHGIACPTAA